MISKRQIRDLAIELAETNLARVPRKTAYAITALQKGDASQVMDIYLKDEYTQQQGGELKDDYISTSYAKTIL